jgi:HD-GYP domain-containing protein (c-di-GMP phosphodiesterase class II)
MQNISTLPLRQALIENHEKINFSLNHDTIVSKTQELEAMSVAKAKEALQILKNLEAKKEAIRIFEERKQSEENLKTIIDQLPDNITETPKFYEAKSQSVELSNLARETFARIGVRAREAFIEDQIERAMAYNIPYESYGDDYYRLMQDIDKYEFLLEKAKEYCVDWDTSEYDPLALEQEIEEAEHLAYLQDQEVRFYYSITRGIER